MCHWPYRPHQLNDSLQSLARAVPDPGVQYRKSQRSQAAAEEMARQRDPRPIPSLDNDSTSPAPKRVKRSALGDASFESHTEQSADLPTQTSDENMNAEIAQAKQLVKELKRAIETREAQEERGADLTDDHRGTKRAQSAGAGVSVSGSGVQERLIKTNKRVQEGNPLMGGVKTVAYGSIILGIGLGLGALVHFHSISTQTGFVALTI